MNELLTTRELQTLLRVDRITIYRMLQQGLLTGFKVGGQWRFSRQEIESWLEAQRDALPRAEAGLAEPIEAGSGALPLSCIQNMQDIFAEALDVAAVTTDLSGTPLTRLSNSCAFCDAILATPEGGERCRAAWAVQGSGSAHAPTVGVCRAGLATIVAPVRVENERVANVATCQFALGEGNEWQAGLPALADDLGLSVEELSPLVDSVRAFPQDALTRFSHLLRRVADTFSEVGEERLALLQRLQRIAEITKV